ncbi:MAG: hypothetical protein EZS28_040432 [Streblomastix strix]|uniref:Uncharacterized protein n=1 Tax=Streblomastix strix TaxID=222440 RepID=A0A5J4U203_9EUKA|nr:MAG: hypothetical protein EZS28_040432 [Streblomastix strix]
MQIFVKIKSVPFKDNYELPTEFDSREQWPDLMTPVRDQAVFTKLRVEVAGLLQSLKSLEIVQAHLDAHVE